MAAATLSRDPYKSFRFKVAVKPFNNEDKFGYVAGVSSVGALSQKTESIEFRAGSGPLAKKNTPGQTNYEPATLERGLTNNAEFHEWAQKLDSVKDSYANDFRKDVKISLCDENGNEGVSFILLNCWVSQYKAMPDLDAGANSIAIESITLEHEGWNETDWNTNDDAPAKNIGASEGPRDSSIW